MKKWYAEEYEFTVEVTGFLRGDHTERYCRNGEESGDTYHCTYGCPVNQDGQGICSKTMMMLYPLMEAVRSGGDLTHRDFLGSLMALGLTREKIGDILVEKGGCQVLLDPSMTDFLLQNWDSAGREKLTVTPLPLSALAVPHAAVKELRDTVSSLRLDNVLAAGFSLSRGRAAEAVEKGSVQVNYVTCVKPDKPVSAGDTITCRGLGKCVLDSVGAPTKKGRLPVAIRRYI